LRRPSAPYDNAKIAATLKKVLTYALADGQKDCAPSGYVPIPDSVGPAVVQAVNWIGS